MNHYLIKFSGEIGTKRKGTRQNFVKKLAKNIRSGVASKSDELSVGDASLRVTWDNLILSCSGDYDDILQRMPGIQNFSKVEIIKFKDFETLLKQAAKKFKSSVKGKTFAVRCKHIDKANNDFSRMELERELGGHLVNFGKVNLSQPDVTCYIEVRGDEAHLSDEIIQGTGGMPVSAQGKALNMLSGGIDSPVAAWHGYRMGLYQHYVFFDLGSKEQRERTIQIAQTLQNKWGISSKSKLYIVDFKEVIAEILKANRRLHNLILKYFFYITAEKLAGRLFCEAIITGEALGQVSTQTLQNLAALDKVTDLLIIRPVSAMPKIEIIKIAKELGIFDLAYKGKEYCAIASNNVVTAATYEKLMEQVSTLDLNIVDEVLENMEVLKLWDLKLSERKFELEIPDGYTIIDLRLKEELK